MVWMNDERAPRVAVRSWRLSPGLSRQVSYAPMAARNAFSGWTFIPASLRRISSNSDAPRAAGGSQAQTRHAPQALQSRQPGYSESFREPEKLLSECRRLGLEGIVSKRKDPLYRSGKCDWVKVRRSPNSQAWLRFRHRINSPSLCFVPAVKLKLPLLQGFVRFRTRATVDGVHKYQ